jgi:hypothetical protein
MSEQPNTPRNEIEKVEDKKPVFESSIKRHQIRHFETLGGKTVEFNLQNTKIYSHPEEFQEFDHVYRLKSSPEENNVYYFKQDYDRLYETITALGFMAIRQAYPTETDEQLYYQFQENKLQRELDKFSNGGDL